MQPSLSPVKKSHLGSRSIVHLALDIMIQMQKNGEKKKALYISVNAVIKIMTVIMNGCNKKFH